MFEELDRSAATKFCDSAFESGEIFFKAVICNHRDKGDLKFTEGSVLFTRYVLYMDAFGDLGSSGASCIRWGLPWVS